MTWVIGASTAFGYGIMLSDICVTYKVNGEQKTIDALQKIYPLAPFVVGGFAGSVRIGLNLLSSLSEFLEPPEQNIAWKLDWVVDNWSPIAKKIFNQHAPEEKKAQSHILLIAAHPTENVGLPNEAKIDLAILRSPNFTPEFERGGFLTIKHIGSGATTYEPTIKEILDDSFSLASFERGIVGGMGHSLGIILRDRLQEKPSRGISQHLQYIMVRRGGISEVGDTSYIEYDRHGKKTEVRVPQVAKNYGELLKSLGLKDGQAVLIG